VARETASADAAFLGPQRAKAALAALARAGVEHRDVVLLKEHTAASGRGGEDDPMVGAWATDAFAPGRVVGPRVECGGTLNTRGPNAYKIRAGAEPLLTVR